MAEAKIILPKPPQDGEPPATGTFQKASGARPKLVDDHNKAIAEAAAKQFKKKEKQIQKACRKLDEPKDQGCSCIIL